MKYLELIKSIVLLLLVVLSFTFTFAIWSYSPRYETVSTLPTVDISIAEKTMTKEVIKPYKVVMNFDGDLRGTYATEEIENIVDEMQKWEVTNIMLADNDYTTSEQDILVRKSNQFILYFNGDVPLSVYNDVLNLQSEELPDATFNSIVVDWNPSGFSMNIHFISKADGKKKGSIYNATAKTNDSQSFHRTILKAGREFGVYREVDEERSPFLAVPINPISTNEYTYYEKEISLTRFRDALFADPNAVSLSQSGAVHEAYQDDHALMNVDKDKKTLSYVLPTAESRQYASPSELFKETFNFINEHGGWTDDYRYIYMSPRKRSVKYQLHVQGLPVFGDTPGITEITEVWGNAQNYRYMRPYYTLDFPLQTTEKRLDTGLAVVEGLKNTDLLDFANVDEITPGYYMRHDREQKLFIMEPSWFYLINGIWARYSPELLGGEMIGLE